MRICDDTSFLAAGRCQYAKTTRHLQPRHLQEQGECYAGGDALPEVATESWGRNETDVRQSDLGELGLKTDTDMR